MAKQGQLEYETFARTMQALNSSSPKGVRWALLSHGIQQRG